MASHELSEVAQHAAAMYQQHQIESLFPTLPHSIDQLMQPIDTMFAQDPELLASTPGTTLLAPPTGYDDPLSDFQAQLQQKYKEILQELLASTPGYAQVSANDLQNVLNSSVDELFADAAIPTWEPAPGFWQPSSLPETSKSRGHSLEDVLQFVEGLPEVPMTDLDEQSRQCAICWGQYGDNASLIEGRPEKPVRLPSPCSHVFGRSCLEVLLKPKSEAGWGEKLCPLCRREIEGITK